MNAYLHDIETITQETQPRTPWSVVLTYAPGTDDEDTFAWAGQAESQPDAVTRAYTAMIRDITPATSLGLRTDAHFNPEYDYKISGVFAGANIWAAADMLAVLQDLHTLACERPHSFEAVVPRELRCRMAQAIVAGEGRA